MIEDKEISLQDMGGATDLLCPRCRADYLHHTTVTAHGDIRIRFWCEGCCPENSADVIELKIAQHKGSTEIGWRYTPKT
jgi:hypothetical protein